MKPYGNHNQGAEETNDAQKPGRIKAGDLNLAQATKTYSFWFFVTFMFICGSADFMVTTHLIPLVTDYNISPTTAGNMLAWLGLMSLVGLLVANTFYWNRIALLSLGLADYPAKVNSIAAVLKIIGIFTIVPIFGYLGSSALLSGFYIFSVSLNVRKTFRELKFRWSKTQ